MQFEARGTVTGFTQFAGAIDGQQVDANTLFVEVAIGKMGKGSRTAGKKCQDADVIKKIEHLPFPFEAVLVMVEEATRNKETMVIVEIRPVKSVAKVG